jgi:pyoverdine/dityrosine biosynthesis protein Dit1
MSSTTTNNEQPTSNGAEKSSVVVPVPETKDADEALALRILRIIETYGVNYERSDESWEGLKGFLELVTKNVKNKEPVLMLLPGFPFKAPNAVDKVLGVLPDLGEELALSHLNSICDNIEAIYEHGAEIHICSDGLVYNGKQGNCMRQQRKTDSKQIS